MLCFRKLIALTARTDSHTLHAESLRNPDINYQSEEIYFDVKRSFFWIPLFFSSTLLPNRVTVRLDVKRPLVSSNQSIRSL